MRSRIVSEYCNFFLENSIINEIDTLVYKTFEWCNIQLKYNVFSHPRYITYKKVSISMQTIYIFNESIFVPLINIAIGLMISLC